MQIAWWYQNGCQGAPPKGMYPEDPRGYIAPSQPSGGVGKLLDATQTVLDAGGFVPVAGEPLDAINALISLFRGDWVNAGLSAAAMIPFFGWAATGGKWVKKGAKWVDDATGLVIKDGSKMTQNEVMEAGLIWVANKEGKYIDLGGGRFSNLERTKEFRILDVDLTGDWGKTHPHANFDYLMNYDENKN
jgi:hypothetical protein